MIRALEAIIQVTELKVLQTMDIASDAVVVQAWFIGSGSFMHTTHRLQLAIVDIDKATRVPSSFFFGCRDRDDRIANETHLVGT